MLIIHITCSQLAVHYWLTVKDHIKVQIDNNYKAMGLCNVLCAWCPTGGNDENHENLNHYNQLLDYCLKLGAPKYEREQSTQPPDALTPY